MRAVKLAASILVSGEYDTSPGDMTFEPLTRHAAKAAWAEAGLGPQDIDFAEVHDCFSIAEATRVEGLGLFDPGTYLDAVQRGEASPTGRLPVNSSGGLLGKGHPLGATGIAQVVELANQIRGDAGARQLGKARVGVAHCRGGKAVGVEGTACTVHVLIK
jgi:acetyl-CoA acetyltransferase